MKEYGERIRKLRELLGISQQELASMLAVHKQMVSDVERGKQRRFSLESEAMLIEKLGIDPIWLLTGKGEIIRSKEEELKEELNLLAKYFRRLPSYKRVSALVEILKILDRYSR